MTTSHAKGCHQSHIVPNHDETMILVGSTVMSDDRQTDRAARTTRGGYLAHDGGGAADATELREVRALGAVTDRKHVRCAPC
jgi:hypothetical protein